MVWVIPAILWLGLAEDRPRLGVPLAIGTAVLFWIAPIWWVPYVGTSDLHLNAWQLVAGNSFFFARADLPAGCGGSPGAAQIHSSADDGGQLLSGSG